MTSPGAPVFHFVGAVHAGAGGAAVAAVGKAVTVQLQALALLAVALLGAAAGDMTDGQRKWVRQPVRTAQHSCTPTATARPERQCAAKRWPLCSHKKAQMRQQRSHPPNTTWGPTPGVTTALSSSGDIGSRLSGMPPLLLVRPRPPLARRPTGVPAASAAARAAAAAPAAAARAGRRLLPGPPPSPTIPATPLEASIAAVTAACVAACTAGESRE